MDEQMRAYLLTSGDIVSSEDAGATAIESSAPTTAGSADGSLGIGSLKGEQP